MKVFCVLILLVSFFQLRAQEVFWDTIPVLPAHYNEKLAEFRKQKETQGKILFLGNSITEGGDFKKLTGDTTVVNRGIGGDITFGVLNRLDEIIRFRPSKVFILIGINDLSKNIPESIILRNMFSIVNLLKAGSPNTEIYVQSILPVNSSIKTFPRGYDVNEKILTLNTQLSNISKRLKFTFIDLHKSFRTRDGVMDPKYTRDGLHLNAEGYKLWIKILKDGKHL
jgi:lysophospholipase L1-like esterase